MGVHNTEVYADVKMLLDIPEDEPIFIIRAQDVVAPDAIMDYAELARVRHGATQEFYNLVAATHTELSVWRQFVGWQEEHPDKVKIPD